jgi:hypothetical protein
MIIPGANVLTEAIRAPQAPWRLPGNDLGIGYDAHGHLVILSYQDRARHVYIPGRTGTGKSRLISSMIRQDIAGHRRTNCPIVVFDLHGELVNSIRDVLACDVRATDLPIVVIDVTERDTVISWNPLKRHPSVDPAVSAKLLAEAVMHASGKLDLQQAPTLQRTMTTIFHVGIERGLTLAQLFELTDPMAGARRAEIAASISDVRIRADLLRMNGLTKQRFEEEMLAFHNRLSGLTSTACIRAMTSSAENSFDFTWALETGAIVLVNLATSGGTVTETDARMLASLMMTELWQAAQHRGKGAAGERRPCYVYVDEAPFIATPAIALELAQARGFGLHFTIAAQATSQFEDFGGAYGRAIRKAVLRDTLTKVILGQTAEEDDITPLARELALAHYDPLLRKHTTPSYQVVGEEQEEYWTRSVTDTDGTAEGESAATAHSRQRSTSTNWSSTSSSGGGFGTSYSHSTSDGVVEAELLAAETHPERTSHSETDGYAMSDHSTWGETTADGGSEQEGEAETTAKGRTKQTTRSRSETRQQHLRWRPIIEESENVQFFGFDDQLRMWEKALFTLSARQALLSRQGMPAITITTPTVTDPAYVDPDWVVKMLGDLRVGQGFWLSLAEMQALPASIAAAEGEVTRLLSYGRRSANQPVAKYEEADT